MCSCRRYQRLLWAAATANVCAVAATAAELRVNAVFTRMLCKQQFSSITPKQIAHTRGAAAQRETGVYTLHTLCKLYRSAYLRVLSYVVTAKRC
jgi:hypothetical protein